MIIPSTGDHGLFRSDHHKSRQAVRELKYIILGWQPGDIDMRLQLTIFTFVMTFGYFAHAESCLEAYHSAITKCAAHEQSLDAANLTIVSNETRDRVIGSERTKLENLRERCIQSQNTCAIACDEEMETASIEGGDVTSALERVSDCRSGKVALEIKTMNRKISGLQRLLSPPPEGHQVKSADFLN